MAADTEKLMEVSSESLETFLAAHPGASLMDYKRAVIAAKNTHEDARARQNAQHMQWIRENLMGKHVMVKMTGTYTILRFEDGPDGLTAVPEYELTCDMHNRIAGRPGQFPELYKLVKMNQCDKFFQLTRIKSPYNKRGSLLALGMQHTYDTYIMSDRYYDALVNTFKEYTDVCQTMNKLVDCLGKDQVDVMAKMLLKRAYKD